jgi:predicted NUDIX family NTP pyrophosphohydrolase
MKQEQQERQSAGLLMYRFMEGRLEVFIAHPGGPFFAHRDANCWSIPKGEPSLEEDLLDAAQREFFEETGIAPSGPFIPLGTIRQKGGKLVRAWAFAGELPPGHIHNCNTFSLEWPPGSGKQQEFPEIDRACFFPVNKARERLKERQHPFLERLQEALQARPSEDSQ